MDLLRVSKSKLVPRESYLCQAHNFRFLEVNHSWHGVLKLNGWGSAEVKMVDRINTLPIVITPQKTKCNVFNCVLQYFHLDFVVVVFCRVFGGIIGTFSVSNAS